jgi:hypothetical protein
VERPDTGRTAAEAEPRTPAAIAVRQEQEAAGTGPAEADPVLTGPGPDTAVAELRTAEPDIAGPDIAGPRTAVGARPAGLAAADSMLPDSGSAEDSRHSGDSPRPIDSDSSLESRALCGFEPSRNESSPIASPGPKSSAARRIDFERTTGLPTQGRQGLAVRRQESELASEDSLTTAVCDEASSVTVFSTNSHSPLQSGRQL